MIDMFIERLFALLDKHGAHLYGSYDVENRIFHFRVCKEAFIYHICIDISRVHSEEEFQFILLENIHKAIKELDKRIKVGDLDE